MTGLTLSLMSALATATGLLSSILWLRGVLLYPPREEPGDPTSHGLSAQPSHPQLDSGNALFHT